MKSACAKARTPTPSSADGDLRGLAAPEAANNAARPPAPSCPMLTLGVPGSGTTAVMMGALALYNITPGPVLFTSSRRWSGA
jgi:putative tricarboxylic transport membrane protein